MNRRASPHHPFARMPRIACLAAAALALAACSTSPRYPEAPRDAATIDYRYIIGPLDTVNIIVWRNPELSLTVPVRMTAWKICKGRRFRRSITYLHGNRRTLH